MTYNGQPKTIVRADSLVAGDLIDGSLILSRLAAEGFEADPHDWHDAEWRLWDVERVTPHPDGSVVVTTGRHGIWNLRGDFPAHKRGSLVPGRGAA